MSDDGKRDGSGPHLPPTQRDLKAVRIEIGDSLPPSAQPRAAWLPPKMPSGAPPASAPVPPRIVRLEDSAEEDWGDRETVLSRDTVVSDLPPPEAPRDRALLLRMDGPSAGEIITVTDAAVRLGRHPTNEVPINDRGVSRVHAHLRFEAGSHVIEDGGSSNGTFVHGERIARRVLEDGDVIQLGPRASYRYTLADSRQEQLLRQMHRSSTRDALTGIYNRQHFTERLAAEHAYALRHQSSVAVVLFDIDHFKRVNDTYGHPAGDEVLRYVTATINQRMRTEDVFARWGGEEFIALLRGADLQAAHHMGERMRVAVSTRPARAEGHDIPVTVSAGCAALGCTEERDPEALVAIADRRLYAAKGAGRNRVASSD